MSNSIKTKWKTYFTGSLTGSIMALTGAMMALSMSSGMASAATVSVSSYDNGFYFYNGYHYSANTSIITGGGANDNRRSFFAFDLSNINLSNITSATFTVAWGTGSYRSNDTSLSLGLYDVETEMTSLLSNSSPFSSEGLATFADLGSGDQYGTTDVQTPVFTTWTSMPEVQVVLNNYAIIDIASAIAGGGSFAIGASVAASSNYLWNGVSGTGLATLTLSDDPLTAVPLPASGLLLLGGLGGLGGLGALRKWGGLTVLRRRLKAA